MPIFNVQEGNKVVNRIIAETEEDALIAVAPATVFLHSDENLIEIGSVYDEIAERWVSPEEQN